MRPEDLDLLSATGRPALTPDGRHVVVAVVRPDLDSDTYTGGLWLVPVDGGPARRLTNGHRDTAPGDQPGRAARRLPAGRQGQPAAAARHRTRRRRAARADRPPAGRGRCRSWSPDGRRLAYVARVPEPGRYGTEDADGHKPGSDAERAAADHRRAAYRVDDLGFTRDRRAHLFVLDVPEESGGRGGGAARTPGDPAPADRRRHRRRRRRRGARTARRLAFVSAPARHPRDRPPRRGVRRAGRCRRRPSAEPDRRGGARRARLGGAVAARPPARPRRPTTSAPPAWTSWAGRTPCG